MVAGYPDRSKTIHFGVVSALPELFTSWVNNGVIGRAFKDSLLNIDITNPHDFAKGNYQSIDDVPYGGGPGMVMMLEPTLSALNKLQQSIGNSQVHMLAPEGRRFDSSSTNEWMQCSNHIFICGRYEGIDERIIEIVRPKVWSIGDFVLCGGELAAMTIMETLARNIPGVLGNSKSASEDSFVTTSKKEKYPLDHPHYTRPGEYKSLSTPNVLLSGNHKKIDEWRCLHQMLRCWENRPDLLRGYIPNTHLKELNCYFQQKNSSYFEEKAAGNKKNSDFS